ncbi:unnamed protein product [Calicophoron daubneyi]|uniref:KNTC1 first ARM-repeats domain-containing protein n=1 Tax=Calicophoron daubneyi TaxID=300641 RepID=A0AAV2TRU9_CALDB
MERNSAVFNPTAFDDGEPKFRKACWTPGGRYVLCLSELGQLYLFNMISGWCLGVLSTLPTIRDFCIGAAIGEEENPDPPFVGLSPFNLVILRDHNENDAPMAEGGNTLFSIVEIISFPGGKVLYQMRAASSCWLLSGATDGSLVDDPADRSCTHVPFVEVENNLEGTETDLVLKFLNSVDPRQRIERLIEENRFDEANEVAFAFGLRGDIVHSMRAAEMRWLLRTLSEDNLTVDERDVICTKLLRCVDLFEELLLHEDLIRDLLQIVLPSSDKQMKLLLLLKEKLCKETKRNNLVPEVFAQIKRLKLFLLLYGHERFSHRDWVDFREVEIYALFARLLVLDTLTDGTSEEHNPSKAFIVWNLYKTELTELLNWESLKLLCSALSKRCLVYPSQVSEKSDTYKADFIAVETAIHRWLRNELLPATVIVDFLILRVKQLERCSSTQASSLSHCHSNPPVCPFSWPSAALSWTDSFLEAAVSGNAGVETVFKTTGDEVDFYLSGLASSDPDVDPLARLRKLSKQLRTIQLLREKYHCLLSLDCCDGETEMSLAYRILDVAFRMGTHFNGGVDTLTARYLEDRKIDLQTFYQGYALDLVSRIRASIHFSTEYTNSASPDTLGPEDESPQSAEHTSSLWGRDPELMIQRACLVAGWITVPLCQLKVVTSLAFTVSPPWSAELLDLAGKVLSYAESHGLIARNEAETLRRGRSALGMSCRLLRLRRLVRIARVHEVLHRFNIADIQLDDMTCEDGLLFAERCVKRILLKLPDPFGPSSASNAETADMKAKVERSIRVIAQELIPSPDWVMWLTCRRLLFILEASTAPRDLTENGGGSVSVTTELEDRVSFFHSQLDLIATEAHQELCVADHGANLSTRQTIVTVKGFLVDTALKWIDDVLSQHDYKPPEQVNLLLSIGASLYQIARCGLNNGCQNPETVSIAQFVQQLRGDHALYSDSFLSSTSFRHLVTADLASRSTLALNLSLWFLTHKVELHSYTKEVPVRLKLLYSALLPEVPPSARLCLLSWHWGLAFLHRLTDQSSDSGDAGPCSVLTNLLELSSIVDKIFHSLKEVTLQSSCRRQRKMFRKKNETAKRSSSDSQVSSSLVFACSFCCRLWNSPYGRLGCFLQNWAELISPIIQNVLNMKCPFSTADLHAGLRAVASCLRSFSCLLQWTAEPGASGPLNSPNQAFLSCNCAFQVCGGSYQGLCQIVEAHCKFIMAVADSVSFAATSCASDDPLDTWSFTPMFKEESNSSEDHVSAVTDVRSALSWLSSLFSWILHLKVDQVLGESPENDRMQMFNYLTHGLATNASLWATRYGLCITASIPAYFGFVRLMSCMMKWDSCSYLLKEVDKDESAEEFSGLLTVWQDFLKSSLGYLSSWVTKSLGSVLNPPEGKYLDERMALGLALGSPIEEATSAVRSIVASNRDTPKKMKVVAAVIYVFALVAPERGSIFLQLSLNMAKTWKWRAILKPYGLNFGRALAHSQEKKMFESVLMKLCRIVPALKQPSDQSHIKGILLPSNESASNPFTSSVDGRSDRRVPPLNLIIMFAKDFDLSLRRSLVIHLKALFTPISEAPGLDSLPPSFDMPPVKPSGDHPCTLGYDLTSANDNGMEAYRLYQKIVLSRAHFVLKRLFLLMKPVHEELIQMLRDFYSSCSPYDYERLGFLFAWLHTCSPNAVEAENLSLLALLGSYKRLSPPGEYEREKISARTNDKLLMLSKSESQHPLASVRMPYQLLLSHTPPVNIIASEVTVNTIDFWLRINQLMNWNIADSLRLMAANNLLDQYDRAGILPLICNKRSDQSVVSTAAGWDRAFPCQSVTDPLFSGLRALLQAITAQDKVLTFLAGLVRRTLYGPHRLSVLQIARDLTNTWLVMADEQARLAFAQKHAEESSTESTVACYEEDENDSEGRAQKLVDWTRTAAQRAEASYRLLSMEACLYKNHMADWEEVNQQLQSPADLITTLLRKVTSVLIKTSEASDYSGLPVSELSLRSRLLKVLPKIAQLARIDFLEFGCHLIINQLCLPRHLLRTSNPAEVDANLSNESFLLDTTIKAGGIDAGDITLDTTMAPVFHRDNRNAQSQDRKEATEEDFLIAELLLSDPSIRQELLPNLEAFVFTGDPNAYLFPRWTAAKCILHCQDGMLLRPRLSLDELRGTLLRLAILAGSETPLHQRLLIEASESCASSKGEIYSHLHPPLIEDCVQQLLNSEVNRPSAFQLAGELALDFNILNKEILTKILSFAHSQVSVNSVRYLARLMDHLRSCCSPWESLRWLGTNFIDSKIPAIHFLPELMQKLFSLVLGTDLDKTTRPGLLTCSVLSCLIGWPFPDENFEQALLSPASLMITPVKKESSMNYSNARIVLLSAFLRLLSATCSNQEVGIILHRFMDMVSNDADRKEQLSLIANAISLSEVCLTAGCFSNV